MAELKDKELNEVVGSGSVSASGSVDSLRSTYPDEEGFTIRIIQQKSAVRLDERLDKILRTVGIL